MKLIISGTTGVGKTTTVNLIKEHYEKLNKKVVVLSEMILESPFFDLFYNNLMSWGFLSQIEFVLNRFKQWIKVEEKYKNINSNDYLIIYDRCFVEDIIFAELENVKDSIPNSLTESYRIIYLELIDKIKSYDKPDFFILLKANYETVKERQFGQRNRLEENLIDSSFWKDLYNKYYLNERYKKFFKSNCKNFITLNTNDLNPQEVKNKITKYIETKK